MSTHSSISILLPDGKIKAIYCHSDGYFEGVGKILLYYYCTPEKAEALISLGDLSFLGEYLHHYEGYRENPTDQEQLTVTCAYHRDRGQPFKNVKPRIHLTIQKWINKGQEYNYIFKSGEWYGVKQKHIGSNPTQINWYDLEPLKNIPEAL